MNKKNYKWIVYFIGFTIAITIAVQVYWNGREYQINKQQLISKVQLSLDNSVEAYFANLTKSGLITLTSMDSLNSPKKTDTIILKTPYKQSFRKKIDSTLKYIASTNKQSPILVKRSENDSYGHVLLNENLTDNFGGLLSKVIISITRDTLNLKKLDSFLIKEFERKNIDVTYGFKYNYRKRNKQDSIVTEIIEYKLDKFPEKHLFTTSKSTFLPHRSKLEIFFTNETVTILRDSLISILLSLLLSVSIIGSILYLLKTIYKQKQLAEVKNDLISNITHEFKTPIATISAALEALNVFKALDDKTKSKKYISIASSQVIKLNEMVEKILETATLNHDELQLEKQEVEIIELIENIIEKFKIINPTIHFDFKKNTENCVILIDKFHFENAIGNIVDNAIKYGGNTVHIDLQKSRNRVKVQIKDNGNGIHKDLKNKVFDQFYRIPTGNTHNVKGFGIGLYYTRKIIEKHGGTVQITYSKNNDMMFNIELSYE